MIGMGRSSRLDPVGGGGEGGVDVCSGSSGMTES